MSHTTPTRDEAVLTGWRYSINYGPDGEQNFANVYAADGQFVGNLRTHHAIAICNAFAVCEKLASAPAPASGGVDAVAVKSLEWQADPFSEALIADTNGLGRYVIVPYEGQFKVTGGNVRSLKPTVEAAQIKAQADYEQRIRSVLSPPAVSPAGGVSVDEKVLRGIIARWDCRREYLNTNPSAKDIWIAQEIAALSQSTSAGRVGE